MSVGAVYVSSMIARSGIWIYKRLFGSSGGQFGEQGQRGDRLPCLRMLQHSSDEEERGVESEHRHGGSYAAVADMNELRQMVEQSRAIQCDPHNKMHGRSVRDWQDEDSDGSRPNVKLHTSDQLPRRRKKKGPSKRGQQRDEMNEEDDHRAWQSLLETTGNLHAPSSSTMRRPQSGSSSSEKGASKGMSSRSGSGATMQADLAPISMSSRSGSGATMQADLAPMSMSSRSGSGAMMQADLAPMSMSSRSGSGATMQADLAPMNMTSRSGYSTMQRGDGGSTSCPMTSQSGSSKAAGAGSTSKNLTSQSGFSTAAGAAAAMSAPLSFNASGSGDHAAAAERVRSVSQGNSWNEFQHEFRGRGWGTEKMRDEYWRFQASGKKPK